VTLTTTLVSGILEQRCSLLIHVTATVRRTISDRRTDQLPNRSTSSPPTAAQLVGVQDGGSWHERFHNVPTPNL